MMKYRHSITPQAREEFKMAREWYKSVQVKGLSNRFAQAVKDTLRSIENNPFVYAVRYRDVRIAHTRTFPYAIHFYIENDVLFVTAIIFQGRNPLIAKTRI